MYKLCKYKDIFGNSGQGIHSYRLFGIAIIDVLMTVMLAFIIKYFTKYSFLYILITLFILGIFLHHLFCVKTTIDKLLFN